MSSFEEDACFGVPRARLVVGEPWLLQFRSTNCLSLNDSIIKLVLYYKDVVPCNCHKMPGKVVIEKCYCCLGNSQLVINNL